MIDQGQRFQIARRFEFSDQGAALRFVRRLADLRRDCGGDYELDLVGNTLTVRIAAAPLQAESSATLMRRLECWYYGSATAKGTTSRRSPANPNSEPRVS